PDGFLVEVDARRRSAPAHPSEAPVADRQGLEPVLGRPGEGKGTGRHPRSPPAVSPDFQKRCSETNAAAICTIDTSDPTIVSVCRLGMVMEAWLQPVRPTVSGISSWSVSTRSGSR